MDDATPATLHGDEAAPSQVSPPKTSLTILPASTANGCPDIFSTVLVEANDAECNILPLTAENLANVPDIERLKSSREREVDEVVDKLRELQYQMKDMIVDLREQRAFERQLEQEAEENERRTHL